MIKNYIFDFGNVLAKYEPEAITALYIEDKADIKIVTDAVFDRLYWDKLDAGTITDEEVKEGFCKRLPENLREAACKVYDGWIDLRYAMDGMPELVYDIKEQGGKLYLLSNISIGFAENYHRSLWISKLFSLFDGLVFSGPIGITKPNREIFEYILNKYSLKAEECIFIDDSEKNIIGAEAVGIKGYLFDGNAEKLRRFLGF